MVEENVSLGVPWVRPVVGVGAGRAPVLGHRPTATLSRATQVQMFQVVQAQRKSVVGRVARANFPLPGNHLRLRYRRLLIPGYRLGRRLHFPRSWDRSWRYILVHFGHHLRGHPVLQAKKGVARDRVRRRSWEVVRISIWWRVTQIGSI